MTDAMIEGKKQEGLRAECCSHCFDTYYKSRVSAFGLNSTFAAAMESVPWTCDIGSFPS